MGETPVGEVEVKNADGRVAAGRGAFGDHENTLLLSRMQWP